MERFIKRLIAVILVSSLLMCEVYADNGVTAGVPAGTSAAGGTSQPTNHGWGWRVTMTTNQPMQEAGLGKIDASATMEQLVDQYTAIVNINKTRYWKPGNYGLYYMAPEDEVGSERPVPQLGIADASTPTYFQNLIVKDCGTESLSSDSNELAWMCYNPDFETQRPSSGACQFSEQLYSYLIGKEGRKAASADPHSWISTLRAMYNSAGGHDPVDILQQLSNGDPSTMVSNWNAFTWAALTAEDLSATTLTDPAWQKVRWSVLGYLTTCVYFVWAAQDTDTYTYEDSLMKLAKWVGSGFDGANMPILEIEAWGGVYDNGVPVAATIPYQLYSSYGAAPDLIYQGWGTELTEWSGDSGILALFGGHHGWEPLSMGAAAKLMCLFAGYSAGGLWVSETLHPFRQRAKTISPTGDDDLYGWGVHFTYYVDDPFDGGGDPGGGGGDGGGEDPPGKFTWDLTPKGFYDETPATEIEEPSTIVNLNIAQNGHNYNNYAKWESLIRGDNSNCNKIRITAYHISQNLTMGKEATEYLRDQVKAGNKTVLTEVDKVMLGDGIFENIPSIGEVKSGEESREMSDDELLNILKTATGITYTEYVAGQLVLDNDDPEGVRVTYAVYVDVNPGCKRWREFENDQAEYIEYRSEPGTYTYKSDDPDGFTEIKCGYFDRDRGYMEPYEAMAGSPTTENLYFVSGGQEFVAQIEYKYTTDKEAIRSFEQKYTTEQCQGYWEPCEKKFENESLTSIQTWLNTNTKNPQTSGEFINQSEACTECGIEHNNTGTVGKETHKLTIKDNVGEDDKPKPGDYYTEASFTATKWDFSAPAAHAKSETEMCPGGEAAYDTDTAPKCQCGSTEGKKTKATSYTGTVKSYHTHHEDNTECENLQSSIKWEQDYTNFNYAAIEYAHVWRLEKARVEGVRQLTFSGSDAILADAETLSNVIFNVAEDDNAKEGRMYYMLHPTDADNFVFSETLPTRGCCGCYNHNAAEDLIESSENPNEMFEDAYVISDYLILETTSGATSLLYHEYQSGNANADLFPVLRIEVSGTSPEERQDNGYTITRWGGKPEPNVDGADASTDEEEFRDWSKRGQVFKADTISFNTTVGGSSRNAMNGTMEKICENSETFYGGGVGSNNDNNTGIPWGGYNGDYSATTKTLAEGTANLEDVGKYSGISGRTNFNSGGKKIFMTGYTHNHQGEVNGFSTESPQDMKHPPEPFILAVNDIDVHDVKVHNGQKDFENSTVFYHNIITYGGGAEYSTKVDGVYRKPGFRKDTHYASNHEGVNSIVIHNPVSTQYARLIPLPSKLDQRVDRNIIAGGLDEDNSKCPGKANSCLYATINCNYTGTRYHTDDCYVEIRQGGLASIPVDGSVQTELHPVEVVTHVEGSAQFGYSGARQVFIAPEKGTYRFELFGAAGGSARNGGVPGKGAKAAGDIKLDKGQMVYVFVGGQGETGYSGGGYNGGGGGSIGGGGGGGMTHISLNETATAALSNRRSDGSWAFDRRNVIIAGGGGGAGSSDAGGGSGGHPNGQAGERYFGTPGGGGSQSAGGSAGTSNATQGWRGSGGSGTTNTTNNGGGGGGGGWFGGGAGGNDYPTFPDCDDSGGGGGSSFAYTVGNAVTNTQFQTGVRNGDGLCKVTWSFDVTTTTMVPSSSGSYEYDRGQAELFAVADKPQIYSIPETGMYSIHLYGARGGGDEQGKPSAGGEGGYAGGQMYFTAGQQVLVTTGGVGGNGISGTSKRILKEWKYPDGCGRVGQTMWSETEPNSQCTEHRLVETGNIRIEGGRLSGGYNGGGHGGSESGGGYGGGGATDIAVKFTYHDSSTMSRMIAGGTYTDGKVDLRADGAFYWGPRVTSKQGHIYRVDYYGEGLDKANFDTYVYKPDNTAVASAAELVHSYVTPEHAQLYWRINVSSRSNGQEFRVFGNNSAILKEIYVVDLDDRLIVAAGGGGADNLGGTLNGADDGSGGKGGGENGENGYSDGVRHYQNAGATATGGFAPGVGESAPVNSDSGGGGAGWYGGKAGGTGNSGGGGGSSNVRKMTGGTTKTGQNNGAGYAVFVRPGKGQVPVKYELNCSEPHHAPNLNRYRMHSGWTHEGGFVCSGNGCTYCQKNVTLYSPSGFAFTEANMENMYIIKHNGQYHLTEGSDTWCDQCGRGVKFDTYTLNNVDYHECVWKATSYDSPAYDTRGAVAPNLHYVFGDDTCYDPCLDDEKHKKVKTDTFAESNTESAGQFVILDYDFQVYFPDIGDFYGNGALGIGGTQMQEGLGYIDDMITTEWLKEKYVIFPFDVTYKGRTYLGGEKIMLGRYNNRTYTWTDDRPTDFTYTFHCLLNNNEAGNANIRFVAVAKNTPYNSSLENDKEDRNYSRYGSNKYAYHDAYKNFHIDVVGRIGALTIEDTGDFRFSNYYKEALSGWRVNEVVHEVDIGKQNNVSADQKTIFGDGIAETTKGLNTWGLTDWLEPIDKLRPFPITPGENNVPALRNQAHRIGYSDYMSLMTMGDYYGENEEELGTSKRLVQIQPFYYYYNLETREWTPVDVYIKDNETYYQINDYGSNKPTTEYKFYYNMSWEDERERRMYTDEERGATENVANNYYRKYPGEPYGDVGEAPVVNVNIPKGVYRISGTANLIFLDDGNRTFIGSRFRYGNNTENNNRIDDLYFQRQAQRWNFTLGLPSTAVFVQKDEPCTPENIAKYDMDKGVILVALDILAKGEVWTLHYDGVPAGERSFYLFANNTTKVSWETAGPNGPESKIVVAVYTDAKTSRQDLTTEGTH